MATFELWNTASGNVLGTFPDEDAALAAVSESVQRNGHAYGETLALGRESSRGNSTIIASGRELVDRAVQRGQMSAPVEGRRRSRSD